MAPKSKSTKPVVAAPGSNWSALKKTLHPIASANSTSVKRRRTLLGSVDSPTSSAVLKGKGRSAIAFDEERDHEGDGVGVASSSSSSSKSGIPIASILAGGSSANYQAGPGRFLAMDCEMVGVGPEGSESTLARVSIVNFHGVTVLDQFVRPREKVTDYRTWVSGVREEDLRHAPTFAVVQKEVADLIEGRVLIGHALTNDTQVLLLSHPWAMTRDTAHYAPLQGLARTKKPGLKTLAKLVLGVDIQGGEHSSVDDARATMAIYRSQKPAWESSLQTHSVPSLHVTSTPFLASLDLSLISLKGVKPSLNPKPKTLGLAATLRNERERQKEAEEREKEAEGKGKGSWGEEQVEERREKKRKREEVDDLVLGFDYEPVVKVVKVKEKAKEVRTEVEKDKKEKKKRSLKKGIRGDEERRPKSQDGWWVE